MIYYSEGTDRRIEGSVCYGSDFQAIHSIT